LVVRALVVDDSRAMRTLLSRILTIHGFDVDQAADGAEALQQLSAGHPSAIALPDIVLIDWNMPVMDGLTLVTQIRRRPEWRQITLMMVTTESEYGQIVRALAAGAHEYLIKPFTADALIEKLAILGLASGAAV
jgi:two-component system chemotaxis response regulator CheY